MFLIKFSILWLSKPLAITLVFASVLTSCGFEPVHKKYNNEGTCNNFTVKKIKEQRVSGHKMRLRLQDRLNQMCINNGKNYKVVLDIDTAREEIGIQIDRAVTRYNLNLNTQYSVYEGDSLKPIYSGYSTITGGFDDVISDFGTYALEQDTQIKLMAESANDIAIRISSALKRKNKAKN